jgi:hypothetical protein
MHPIWPFLCRHEAFGKESAADLGRRAQTRIWCASDSKFGYENSAVPANTAGTSRVSLADSVTVLG